MTWTDRLARSPVEYAIRRLYFAQPALESWYQRVKVRRLRTHARDSRFTPAQLRDLLEREVPRDADIMVHSSMAGLGEGTSPQAVLQVLREFCGSERTLLFPTNPRLRRGPDGVLTYDPARSPSTVGLLSELARRTPGFVRSLHPISSVAARGPRADHYLDGNLNDQRPLPHGIFSPYARLAAAGGITVCLGVPFEKCLTMIHVAEESLDAGFPRRLRFDDMAVRVGATPESAIWTVRVRSRNMLPQLSMWSLHRDLPAVGAVRRRDLGGVLVDIADSRAVVDFMRSRALRDGYPYMHLRR